MNNTLKSVGVSAGVALLVVLGLAYLRPEAPVSVVNNPAPQYGAVSGPDRFSPYESINGMITWYTRVGLTPATTTVCRIKSPNATTTLVQAGIQMITASTSIMNLDFANTTDALSYATTTLMHANITVAANGQVSANASSTIAVLAPSTWIVGKVGGAAATGMATPTNLAPVGSCYAEFQQF